jgi:hypothetical protein
MSQSWPRPCTSSSAQTRAAPPRLAAISSGRRRSRSAITPDSGAVMHPQTNAKKVSPAALLLPVRILTQIAMASHSALSPITEKLCPAM